MTAYQEQALQKVNEAKINNTSTPDISPMKHYRLTLQTKGLFLLGIFVAFAIVTGFIINQERNQLLLQNNQIQAVHMTEETKLKLYLTITRAVLIVNENTSNGKAENMRHQIAIEVNAVLYGMKGLTATYPVIAEDAMALQKNLAELTNPTSLAKPIAPDTIKSVRRNLHKIFIDLNDISNLNAAKERYWMEAYAKTFNRFSQEWIAFGLIGIITLSSLVMIFITRLTWDIRRIQDRAMLIIEGYRGEPIAVNRNDELGTLMQGLNKMQMELRKQEIHVELNRQQQFHKEKMAAIGSLAAIVAHEINNPLSAIVGLSQEMSNLQTTKQCKGPNDRCHPDLLVSQAKKIMAITRHISELSTPQSTEPELFDLNALIRSTVMFISFDRRFHLITPVLSLDPQLPAIYGMNDHITQVLINLLVNAADAMSDMPDRTLRIELSTKRDGDNVILTVADNGPGIKASILPRVFEEFFTTKPPGKGTGIGLALSKSLIDSSGGSIKIESEFGTGTTVTIRLPFTANDNT